MARLEIVKYGDPVLRKITSRVIKFDKSLKKLIEDMFETMYASEGIGLAAPQVGVSKRVLVLDVDYPSRRYENEKEKGEKKDENIYNPMVLVNPVIFQHEGEMDSYEGCLSFPGVFFKVKRYQKIAIRYQDILGKERKLESEGNLLCRCLQHEIDHLDGKLMVDRPADEVEMKKSLSEAGLGNVKSPPLNVLIS